MKYSKKYREKTKTNIVHKLVPDCVALFSLIPYIKFSDYFIELIN